MGSRAATGPLNHGELYTWKTRMSYRQKNGGPIIRATHEVHPKRLTATDKAENAQIGANRSATMRGSLDRMKPNTKSQVRPPKITSEAGMPAARFHRAVGCGPQ
jgi:hypothetical protein